MGFKKIINYLNASLFFLAYFLLLSSNVSAGSGRYLELSSTKENKQAILIYDRENPIATLVLFVGGNGYLNLQKDGSILKLKNNFLLRSIPLFLKENFRVVVYEVPSHKANNKGLLAGYRITKKHSDEIALVVDYLRQHYSQAIWLIGTSRGANSVANAAASLGSQLNGVVLTAPLTEQNKKGSHVLEVDLHEIALPVLLLAHQDDDCWVTPPEGLKRINERLINSSRVGLEIITEATSLQSNSRVCGGLSAHGFLGVEKNVIRSISTFIVDNPLF